MEKKSLQNFLCIAALAGEKLQYMFLPCLHVLQVEGLWVCRYFHIFFPFNLMANLTLKKTKKKKKKIPQNETSFSKKKKRKISLILFSEFFSQNLISQSRKSESAGPVKQVFFFFSPSPNARARAYEVTVIKRSYNLDLIPNSIMVIGLLLLKYINPCGRFWKTLPQSECEISGTST